MFYKTTTKKLLNLFLPIVKGRNFREETNSWNLRNKHLRMANSCWNLLNEIYFHVYRNNCRLCGKNFLEQEIKTIFKYKMTIYYM